MITSDESVSFEVQALAHTHPILILDDVPADGRERGPFAVISGSDSAAFMDLKLTHCKHTHVYI